MSREETSQGDIFAEVQTTPGHLLRRFQQIAVSMFLKECREYDLTPLQYAALAALSVSDPLDQVTLGGMIALDRTTIGVVIRNLEARELVVRETSTRDRRSKMIRISPAGTALLTEVRPLVENVQARLLAPLETEEQHQLVALMQRVVVAHNQESRAPLRP
jgi:DNA-binding MarR family transcriptional regulator